MSRSDSYHRCPECGQFPLQSWEYREGIRAAEAIIAAAHGDRRILENWLRISEAEKKHHLLSDLHFHETIDGRIARLNEELTK